MLLWHWKLEQGLEPDSLSRRFGDPSAPQLSDLPFTDPKEGGEGRNGVGGVEVTLLSLLDILNSIVIPVTGQRKKQNT